MNRYARVYRVFLASALVRELEFRANFFAKVFQNVVWSVFFVAMLAVIYNNTGAVAGWSRGDSFVLAATVFVMNAFVNGFFFSLTDIPSQVRQGSLDFVVTKPIDSQFWVSTRRFNFDQIGTLLCGLAMIGYGAVTAGLSPSPLQWIAYLILVACAIVIFYAVNLAMMTTGIWFVRVDNLWVLGETLNNVVRFPIDIFSFVWRQLFIFAIPLAFLAYIPARQLVFGADAAMVGLGILWAAVSFGAARWFWGFALRHYSSASS